MHFNLYVPMWFAWITYVLFGLIGLCYLAIGVLKALAWAGIHGPHYKPPASYYHCGWDRYSYESETHEEYHARLKGMIVNIEDEERPK